MIKDALFQIGVWIMTVGMFLLAAILSPFTITAMAIEYIRVWKKEHKKRSKNA